MMEEDYSPWGDSGDGRDAFASSSALPPPRSTSSFEIRDSLGTGDEGVAGYGGRVEDGYGFEGGAPQWPSEAQDGWPIESGHTFEPEAGNQVDDYTSRVQPPTMSWSPPTDAISAVSIRDRGDSHSEEEEPAEKEERDWGGFGQSPTLPPIEDDDVDVPPSPPQAVEEGWTAEWEPEEAPPPLPSFGDVFTKAKTAAPPSPPPTTAAAATDADPSWSPPVSVKPTWEPDTLDIEPAKSSAPMTSNDEDEPGDPTWAGTASQGLVKGKSIPASVVDELKIKSRVFAAETWRVPDSTWGTAGFQEPLSATLLETVSEAPSLPSTSAVTLETPLTALFKQSTTLYPAYTQSISKTAAKTAEILTGGQSSGRRLVVGSGRFGAPQQSKTSAIPSDLAAGAATARSSTPPPRVATPTSEGGSPLSSSQQQQQQGALGRLFGRFRRSAAQEPHVPGPTAAAVMGAPYDDPVDPAAVAVEHSASTSAAAAPESAFAADPFAMFEDRPSTRAAVPSSSGDALDDFFSSPAAPASTASVAQAHAQAGRSDFDFFESGDTDRPIVRQELPRNTKSLDPFDPLVSDNTPLSASQSSRKPVALENKLAPVASFGRSDKPSSAAPAKTDDDFDDFFSSFSSPSTAPARPSSTPAAPTAQSRAAATRSPPVSPAGRTASNVASKPGARLAPPPIVRPTSAAASSSRKQPLLSRSTGASPTSTETTFDFGGPSITASGLLAPPPPPSTTMRKGAGSLMDEDGDGQALGPMTDAPSFAPPSKSPVPSVLPPPLSNHGSKSSMGPNNRTGPSSKPAPPQGSGGLTLDDLSFFES